MAKNNTKQVKIEDVLELKKVEDNQNKEIENKRLAPCNGAEAEDFFCVCVCICIP